MTPLGMGTHTCMRLDYEHGMDECLRASLRQRSSPGECDRALTKADYNRAFLRCLLQKHGLTREVETRSKELVHAAIRVEMLSA